MSRLHVMEGPAIPEDVTKLDDFSAGLVYLAQFGRVNPGATVRDALWGDVAQAGPMNGLGFSLKKTLRKTVNVVKKTGNVVGGAVGDYARDIRDQGIGTTLTRLGAAVATGGTSELVFAAKSSLTSGMKNISPSQQSALAKAGAALATTPDASASAVLQVAEAGSRWKSLQEQAKTVTAAKVAGIPIVVVGGLGLGGFILYRMMKK